MTVQEAAVSLFVALGGRGSNYGKLHIVTQTSAGRHRFVVRLGEGAHIKNLHQEWEGFEVVYTGPGEGLPDWVESL